MELLVFACACVHENGRWDTFVCKNYLYAHWDEKISVLFYANVSKRPATMAMGGKDKTTKGDDGEKRKEKCTSKSL